MMARSFNSKPSHCLQAAHFETYESVPRAVQAATMSASKKPPNSASKLRPSLLGGGSSSKGEKTPSRGLMPRMPWGARTPKRSATDSAADHMGVERRCGHRLCIGLTRHNPAFFVQEISVAMMREGQLSALMVIYLQHMPTGLQAECTFRQLCVN